MMHVHKGQEEEAPFSSSPFRGKGRMGEESRAITIKVKEAEVLNMQKSQMVMTIKKKVHFLDWKFSTE